MQHNIISGVIRLPEQKRQRQLHRQLDEFANWLQRPQGATQEQKDNLTHR